MKKRISQLINMILLCIQFCYCFIYISATIITITIPLKDSINRFFRINRRKNKNFIGRFHRIITILLPFLFQECSQKYFARHQFHFLIVNSDRLRLSARASKSAWKNSHVPRGESYAGISLPLCITLAPGC